MQFCDRCGQYYDPTYKVDHIYECYMQVTKNSDGTSTTRITLPGIYKLLESNAIDPKRAMHKLAKYGLVSKGYNNE